MEIKYERSFFKDLDKITDKRVARQLKEKLIEIENSATLSKVSEVKKLKGDKNAFRIKVGNYRLGCFYEKNIVEVIRFLHRKEIYRFFP